MIKTLARFVGLLVAASVIIFLLLRAVPGDPARVALGVTASDADVAELSARLGHASITTTVDVYGHLVPDAHARGASLNHHIARAA